MTINHLSVFYFHFPFLQLFHANLSAKCADACTVGMHEATAIFVFRFF